MSKTIAKDFDVVKNDPPMNGVNPFENPGIEPRTSIPDDPGWSATNDTRPHETPGSIPNYPKGSGY